jgi:hypothetical protein
MSTLPDTTSASSSAAHESTVVLKLGMHDDAEGGFTANFAL